MRLHTVAAAIALILSPSPGRAQNLWTQGTVRAAVIPLVAGARRPALTADLIEQMVIGPLGTPGDNVDAGLSNYLWKASGGTFRLTGIVLPALAAVDHPRGLRPSAGKPLSILLRDIIRASGRSTDLAQFDNDGPDGLPNSGDDDGFLDLVIVTMEAPTPQPEASWLPEKIQVKIGRKTYQTRGVLYVTIPEDGSSPTLAIADALMAAMGVPLGARRLQDAPTEPMGTVSLLSLGWRPALRVERSGTYQPDEASILSVPLLDVPQEKGRWLIRQIRHETDLVRVYGENGTHQIVEHHRVSAEHSEVTIPLTHRQGLRGAQMTLRWPDGPDRPPEVLVDLRGPTDPTKTP